MLKLRITCLAPLEERRAESGEQVYWAKQGRAFSSFGRVSLIIIEFPKRDDA
ncbi:hypothetical protein TRAPUB_181 [Trametes pubescens]|uniref:Uncharacterized protein n=1 Tax=Trametes pubescens TaxID=154538 RepID=A0A1M2VMX5_TRAPU|nr:hypothetical protein TRAPUB_181 [Trametes pubescens]